MRDDFPACCRRRNHASNRFIWSTQSLRSGNNLLRHPDSVHILSRQHLPGIDIAGKYCDLGIVSEPTDGYRHRSTDENGTNEAANKLCACVTWSFSKLKYRPLRSPCSANRWGERLLSRGGHVYLGRHLRA